MSGVCGVCYGDLERNLIKDSTFIADMPEGTAMIVVGSDTTPGIINVSATGQGVHIHNAFVSTPEFIAKHYAPRAVLRREYDDRKRRVKRVVSTWGPLVLVAVLGLAGAVREVTA